MKKKDTIIRIVKIAKFYYVLYNAIWAVKNVSQIAEKSRAIVLNIAGVKLCSYEISKMNA